MSAVKNLRAMFEQKQDASPPDRGRSPGLSSNGTETPPPAARPLSKIRTSFVAVEKDGRVGLRRDPSNDSSVSQRRLSSHTEGEASVSGQSDKTMATEETSGGYKTNVVGETIPESPRRPDSGKAATNAAANGSPRNLGALTDKPSHNPDKHVDVETPTPELLPGDPKQKPASKIPAANGSAAAKPAPKAGAAKETAKAKPATLAPAANIKARGRTPTRSPTVAKTPTLSAGSKLSAPKHHEPAKKTPEKSAGTPKAGAKPAAGSNKPAPVQVSPPGASGAGFVKPKVKSPTRPVKLPPSLMAPTAASVSKYKETPRETTSRASGNRPASRVSTTAAPPKTLKRQNSVINRPRPSIGPPPKKPLQDHPITKKEKEVDEGFLARMMRPTQSSSSKTTEKAPATPPRHRSGTQGSAKKSASVSRSPRRVIKPASDHMGSPVSKKEAPIQQVAPGTAKVETAEVAVDVVKKAEEVVETKTEPEETKAPMTPEPVEAKVEEPSSEKASDPEAAAASGSDVVADERSESPEFDELAEQASKLSLKEAENHELKSPDEFEELLADEKETADKAEPEAAPAVAEPTEF